MFIFPWQKLDANERLAAPILIRELGVLNALRVGRRIRRRAKAGEPFAALGEPTCEDDRLSREQIGPAVLLYQEAREVVDDARALALTEEVAVAAALIFLRAQLGELRRDELASLTPEGRAQFAEERGARFFNATMRWDEVSGERVRFTVTSCRFPPLCAAAGVPELAPVFCEVDARYFGTVEPDIVLTRPTRIAAGDPECAFTLSWRAPDQG